MANSSTCIMAGSNGYARVSFGLAGSAALQDDHWYIVGRLLGPKTRFLGFKGTISSIWRIKSRLTIQDASDRFLFQFEREADKNRALHGGLWFYRNKKLMLSGYDGVGPMEAVPLWSLETWVAVKGLPVGMRNEVGLTLIGSTIGQVIRFDQTALRRREEEQRIQVTLDTRSRIRTWMLFEFSSTVELEIILIFEKVKGLCRDCGLFEHDVMGCDGFLEKEKEDLL
ncbi:uncharacterized protein LOC112170932 [Rosa chinensis]|uniref:uncharacterized protein LOC112170932 n=1 Tax=Rosa chinensis TaxID=74649 RepID=UPI000D0875AC|nr:uncharacterized protein LOC112170932 [Rosa chinensis]